MAQAPEPQFQSEVVDIENWRNPEDSSFNRLIIVMSSIRKCVDLGSKEMREGWWEEKLDKYGNRLRSYHEDTRKSFVEAVKSLMMITVCDFDDDAKEKIKKLKIKLIERKNFWLNEEWIWWDELNIQQRSEMNKTGKNVIKGLFNHRLDFVNYFREEEVEIYRAICSEIISLTNRDEKYLSAVEWEV